MNKPYKDIKLNQNKFIREFNRNIPSTELKWHQDLKDRKITILEGKNWKFQFENQIPIELKTGDKLNIPSLTWHRIIKGETNLKIQIEE